MSPSPLGAFYRSPLGAFYRSPLGAFTGPPGVVAPSVGSYRFSAARLIVDHWKRIGGGGPTEHEKVDDSVTCAVTFSTEGLQALMAALFRGPAGGVPTIVQEWRVASVDLTGFSAFSTGDTWASHPGWVATASGGIVTGDLHWIRCGTNVVGTGALCFDDTGSVNDPLGVSTPYEEITTVGNVVTLRYYLHNTNVYTSGPIYSPTGFVFSFDELMVDLVTPTRRLFAMFELNSALSNGNDGYNSFLTAFFECDLEILTPAVDMTVVP